MTASAYMVFLNVNGWRKKWLFDGWIRDTMPPIFYEQQSGEMRKMVKNVAIVSLSSGIIGEPLFSLRWKSV
jgi:hypothetical protein